MLLNNHLPYTSVPLPAPPHTLRHIIESQHARPADVGRERRLVKFELHHTHVRETRRRLRLQ
jgi:hypothetical protein